MPHSTRTTVLAIILAFQLSVGTYVVLTDTDQMGYTCPPQVYLCPYTDLECSCSFSASNLSYNQWSWTLSFSNNTYTIQLNRTGVNCYNEYLRIDPYIRVWNEGASGSCSNSQNCMCESSTLFIRTSRLPRGTTMSFNCQGGSYSSSNQNVQGVTSVTIISPPNSPTIANIYSDNPNILTIEWYSATSGGMPESFDINITDNDVYSQNTSIVATGSLAQLYSHTFTGLTDNTKYHVFVVAVNCAGSNSSVVAIKNTENSYKDALLYTGTFLVLLIIVIVLMLCIMKFWRNKKNGISLPNTTLPEDTLPTDETPVDVLLPTQTSETTTLISEGNTVGQQLHGTPTLPMLIAFPSKGSTINIIKNIGSNFSTFGTLLLGDDNGAIVDQLQFTHQRDTDGIVRAIFQRWINGQGKEPASWTTLVDALRKTGLCELANKIENCI